MLTQEQRDKILNSESFSKLLKKPEVSENAGLTMAERRAKSKGIQEENQKSFLSKAGDFFTGNTQKFGKTLGTALSSIDPVTNQMREETLDTTNDMIDTLMEKAKNETDPVKAKKIIQSASKLANTENIDIFNNPEYQKTAKQVFGEGLGTLLETLQFSSLGAKGLNTGKLGSELPTVVKPFVSNIKEGAKIGAGYGALFGGGTNVSEAMQEDKSIGDIALSGITGGLEGGVVGTVLGGVAGGVSSGIVKGAEKTGEALKSAKKFSKNIFDKTKEITPAINQTTKDFLSRVPRAVEHAKDYSLEATKRAERIKKSTPEVGKAIEVGVEDKTLNNILEATENTKKEMRKMIDIVEESGDVMPSSLAGESSVKQYEIIDKARKKVGEKLNEAIENLPDTKVSISRKLADLDKTLRQNGLKIQDKQIVRSSNSNITEAELNAINKLYNESIRGVNNIGLLDAKSIQAKNSLISKLKRESSRIENIDDIIIKKPDGTTTSIYSAFKDMFSETLDEISPEIRDINREYATYRNIVDEIDNSILKSSKTNLNINPAESASINLRRVSGEALSTPYFQEVARLMDATARKLGYNGADPVRLINFAEDLRKLYPEAIPRTGFQGGIRTGVSDLADRLIQAGAPNAQDKQKAIKEILDKTSKK